MSHDVFTRLASTLEQEEGSFLKCSPPTDEALETLKKALELKGCLQYKEKGDMIYLVVYDAKKDKGVWSQVGRWRYLASSAHAI